MDTDTDRKRDEALSFLVNHDAGVLSTVSSEGQPSARMIYYTCDDLFNVYFITLKNTRKVAQMTSNGRVAFVVSEMEMPRTIQIEGVAQDISETATNDALLTDFMKRLMSHTPYGIPLERFDMSEIIFYKVSPSWIRWGDFTFGMGTEAVLTHVDASNEE